MAVTEDRGLNCMLSTGIASTGASLGGGEAPWEGELRDPKEIEREDLVWLSSRGEGAEEERRREGSAGREGEERRREGWETGRGRSGG